MVKGYVTNNTGRSRHIFKRTVYPGQKVPLETVYSLVSSKVPKGQLFIDWLDGYLPSGWEIEVSSPKKETPSKSPQKEVSPDKVLEKTSSESSNKEDTSSKKEAAIVKSPTMAYATPKAIDKMTAKDIYNLRIKDNPKRILKNVNSVHKLRRALTLCKNDSRKATLTRLIQGRIRELNITL